MTKRRAGHGPLHVDLRTDAAGAELVLRDDVGSVQVLPVRRDRLAAVRDQLSRTSQPGVPCLVELCAADDDVHERWGTFADVAGAAAVALVLLTADRSAHHARVVAAAGKAAGTGELLRLEAGPRETPAGRPWSAGRWP